MKGRIYMSVHYFETMHLECSITYLMFNSMTEIINITELIVF